MHPRLAFALLVVPLLMASCPEVRHAQPEPLPPLDPELARRNGLRARADCGCLFADCPIHGAYAYTTDAEFNEAQELEQEHQRAVKARAETLAFLERERVMRQAEQARRAAEPRQPDGSREKRRRRKQAERARR